MPATHDMSVIRPKLNRATRLSLLFADYAPVGRGVMSPVMTQVRIIQRGNNLNIYGADAARPPACIGRRDVPITIAM